MNKDLFLSLPERNTNHLIITLMGKITVKHYLNTNLKPYIINGERYYSIYILVTANRQNTKVKSSCFIELYSEKDFKEILEDEPGMIERESSAIKKIVELSILNFGTFDTSLFSLLYSFISNLYTFDIDFEIGMNKKTDEGSNYFLSLGNSERNKLSINIMEFIGDNELWENMTKGISLITYFSSTGQNALRSFLEKSKCAISIDEAIAFINNVVMSECLDKFKWILINNKKNMLYEKYQIVFDDGLTDSLGYYTKKYGVIM